MKAIIIENFGGVETWNIKKLISPKLGLKKYW
jgi:hypothetical protein